MGGHVYTVNPNTEFQVSSVFPDPVPDAVKWRQPYSLNSPNPTLVIITGHTATITNLVTYHFDEIFLTFGPALPQISDDGLEILVYCSAEGRDPEEIFRAHVKNGDQWQEVWLQIPNEGGPIDLSIECGPGPLSDPLADWLGIGELAIGPRNQIKLNRARSKNKLRTQNEIKHFSRTYRMPMFTTQEKVNASAYAQNIIQRESIANPMNIGMHAKTLGKEKSLKVVTVCCGAASTEEAIFKITENRARLTLVDINQDLIELACKRLESVAETSIICGDANKIELPEGEFDIAICVAGLHHIVELEHLIEQLSKCLKPDGEFWSLGEYVGRNGARLWPESYEAANAIFSSLPEKYRKNNTSINEIKPIDANLPNFDCSIGTFEGIRAEDIEAVLLKSFRPVQVNKWSTIAWRIIGPDYVDNYDMDDPNDIKVVDEIVRADVDYFTSGKLNPVALRGIYKPIS